MSARPSFRRRLTVSLGLALGLALAMLGVLVWLGASALGTVEARAVLRGEAAAVERATTAGGRLDAAHYGWDEPHHQFAAPRIDPFFLQVFDARGRVVRTSGNVAALPGYPAAALASTEGDGPLTALARLDLGGNHLYRITEPLRTTDGQAVGTVQLARFDPGLGTRLRQLAVGLAAVLGLLLTALLGLVWAVGGRVVRPLEAITEHATDLSAQTLGDRIPLPPHADRETAALADTLNGALARLDGSFDEMQRFTANAAHELQTPLTVLRGHLDVSLRRDRTPEAYRATQRLLLGEVEGLTRTVHGLLALARIDAGDGLATDAVDLAAVTRSVAEAFRASAEARGLTLRVDAEPVRVDGHPDLLGDVVRNLVDNAVKYTDAGGVTVTVRRQDGHAHLVVEDTGRGIAPEHAARVTDRFWRADTVQHLPGSGLGLTLVARIVERHGGSLRVGAGAHGGALVEVVLPALGE